MEVVRKLGLIALIFLAIAGLTVDIGYGFFCIFDHRTTTDTFYISDQTPVDIKEVKESKNLSEQEIDELEERKLFEVNLYSNVDEPKPGKKTGVVLEELKLNYFTDQSLKANSIISTGMQYVSDYDGKQGLYTNSSTYTLQQKSTTGENIKAAMGGEIDALGKALNIIHEPSAAKEFASETEANDYVSKEFNYYECINQGVTWNANGLQTQLNRNTEFIVKISNEAYKIKLDKYLDTRYDNRPSKWVAWLPWHWHQANDYGGRVEYYNWDMVFQDIMHAITTNNMDTGVHYGVVNLTKYFTVTQHFNTESKKWETASEADKQVAYATVKFNYHTNGAISNKQSIFGIIADDPRFELNEVSYDTNFGQAEIAVNLTADSLEKRYSETYQGYFVSLSIDMQRKLKAMPPYQINVTLDLDKKFNDQAIIGLDVNAFDGFKLESLTIRGNQNFYLLNNSLRGTDLRLINIADTVTIVNVNSGVTL